MKAMALARQKLLKLEERETPRPAPGEILVRVKAVGVCGSDVHYWQDGRIGDRRIRPGMLLGHEFAGVVAELGKGVSGPKIGQKVVVEPGHTCGSCEFCRRGDYNLCPEVVFCGTPPIDGALCEYIVKPEECVFPMLPGMSFAEGAMIEPLACAMHAIDRGRVAAGESVAVLGVGPIGQLVAQAARAAGAGRVYVSDLMPGRVKLAKSLGGDGGAVSGKDDVVKKLLAMTGGRGVDVVFETAGALETPGQAVELAARGGRVVLIGMGVKKKIPLDTMQIISKELDILTIFRFRNIYGRAIEVVAQGMIKLKPLITHRFKLVDSEKAYRLVHSRKQGVIKAMIEV